MSSIPPNAPCPCGSGKKYKKCCRVYHMGVPAPTPEKLMRSRYTAYAAGNMTYIMATTHPESEWHRENAAQWEKELTGLTGSSEYVGLVVHSAPEPNSDSGEVTFTAKIMQNSEDISFTEHSRFKKHDERWKYVDGNISQPEK